MYPNGVHGVHILFTPIFRICDVNTDVVDTDPNSEDNDVYLPACRPQYMCPY